MCLETTDLAVALYGYKGVLIKPENARPIPPLAVRQGQRNPRASEPIQNQKFCFFCHGVCHYDVVAITNAKITDPLRDLKSANYRAFRENSTYSPPPVSQPMRSCDADSEDNSRDFEGRICSGIDVPTSFPALSKRLITGSATTVVLASFLSLPIVQIIPSEATATTSGAYGHVWVTVCCARSGEIRTTNVAPVPPTVYALPTATISPVAATAKSDNL